VVFSNKHVAVQTVKKETRSLVSDLVQTLIKNGKVVYRDAFTELLSEVLIVEGSLANPALYEEAYMSRIDEYPFFVETEEGVTVSGPDIDSFNWEGLSPIYMAVEGLVGTYYELPETLYSTLSDRNLIPKDRIDDFISMPMMTADVVGTNFFLISEEDALMLNRYLSDDDKLVVFPFSDSPGIDILAEGNNRLKMVLSSDKITGPLKSKLSRYSK